MPRLNRRLATVFVLAAVAALGAGSAFAGQPASVGRVQIDMPARVAGSAAIAISISLPRGTAAIEGRVLLNSSAAEVVGLASLGGGAALAPTEVSGGYSFAAYNLRSGSPVLRAVVAPNVSGRISVKVVVDAAADAAGRRLSINGSAARTVTVGVGGASYGAPSAAAHGALRGAVAVRDVVADGVLGKLDLDQVLASWQDAHTNDATCGTLMDAAADVNNDGCIDIVDVQAVLAAKGQRLGGAVIKATSDTIAALGSEATQGFNDTAGSTITVNSSADAVDVNESDLVCADAQGRCTLRAAITTANWTPGANLIAFNLGGVAPVLIQMNPNLPGLLLNDRSGGTTIDGYTKSGSKVNTAANGSNAIPGIELRGTGKLPRQVGLRIVSPHNTVRGIAFDNHYRAIVIEEVEGHDNLIVGNWIGFSGPGTLTKYNGHYNMWIANGASHNTIGTPALADRNVTGGAIKGLALYGPGTDYNTIQNNLFCITPNTASPAECAVGIDFSFGPKHNLIGGTGERERNVFGRTRQNGVEFAHGIDKPGDLTWVTAYNSIVNNWIGFRADGSYNSAYRSGYIPPRDVANDSNAINLSDCSSFNIAEGNFLGSWFDGVNIMWANETGNIVRNNVIGVSPLGQAAPFTRYGILVRNGAHGHTILGNTIRNGGTYGIALIEKDDSAIEISQNIIKDMSGRAIFIAAGGNGGILPPTINSATASAVSGNAMAGAKVELFRASRGAGLNGLPTQYLGSATANASGAWTIGVNLATGVVVTALQTGPNANSSALSTNRAIGSGGNQPSAPVADFSYTQQSGTLRVSFSDASAGGVPTSWSWNYSDGATATAQNPAHTFAAAGTYNVTLVATNAAGSSSITKPVTVTAGGTPSTPTKFASDAFGRTVSNGWGSADTGGAYSLTNAASNYKVVNGAGAIVLSQPNANAAALLNSVSKRDVDIKFRFALDNLPTSGKVTVYAIARKTANAEYRARVTVSGNGTVSVSVSKLVGSTETALGSTQVSGVTAASGSYIWFRAQVVGASPTTIRVKAWAAGASEPGSWQFSATDSQAALQVVGAVGFRLWLTPAATQFPVQVGFDDYTVSSV